MLDRGLIAAAGQRGAALSVAARWLSWRAMANERYAVLILNRREFLDPAKFFERLAQFGVVPADIADIDSERAGLRIEQRLLPRQARARYCRMSPTRSACVAAWALAGTAVPLRREPDWASCCERWRLARKPFIADLPLSTVADDSRSTVPNARTIVICLT
jgi:hypothetical protein